MTDTTTAADKRRSKAAELRAAQRKAAKRRKLIVLGSSFGLVIALAAGIVALGISHNNKTTAATRGAAADASFVQKLRVPAATLDKAGVPQPQAALPSKLTGQPALTKDGKPQVLYVGANYCPFCAAQRWSLAVALSRFGTFSNLSTAYSSSVDTFPSTPTLSFHGSTYTSDYLTFTGVETATSEVKDGKYTPLDTPTDAQMAVLKTYDASPYVASPGAIPFVDFGNQYLFQGAMYSPQLLSGKTPEQVAAALSDPNSPIGKAVNANANVITATLCNLTAGKPGNVCTSPTIAKLRSDLDAQH